MFKGEYNGKAKHDADVEAVLGRAVEMGMKRVIITAGDLATFKEALEMIGSFRKAGKFENLLYTTCGVHPTMANEFERAIEAPKEESANSDQPKDYLSLLLNTALSHHSYIAAVGEFGLDYDRLQFCDKETQLKYFEAQFVLAEKLDRPLFLHMRSCAEDFIDVITRNRHRFTAGVVHSFTGTEEEAQQLINLDLYIGINGCSLKTEENCKVVKSIPVDRIMIETDAPWCEIRPSHFSHKFLKTSFPSVKRERWESQKCVKGRNEPCNIVNVLEAVAAIKEMPIQDLADIIFKNTSSVFFPLLVAKDTTKA
jgi:TatD DNase family protein